MNNYESADILKEASAGIKKEVELLEKTYEEQFQKKGKSFEEFTIKQLAGMTYVLDCIMTKVNV